MKKLIGITLLITITAISFVLSQNVNSKNNQASFLSNNPKVFISSQDINEDDFYCANEIGIYNGSNPNVEATINAAYDACEKMESAKEEMEAAEETLNNEVAANKDLAFSIYETIQAHANTAERYASEARDHADEAQNAADNVEGETPTQSETLLNENQGILVVEEENKQNLQIKNTLVYEQEYEWYRDPSEWTPNVVIDIESNITEEAENFYQEILNNEDLAEFNQEGDYYNFMITIYAESMENNAEHAVNAITESYQNGMLNMNQFTNYSANNQSLNNALQNIQY